LGGEKLLNAGRTVSSTTLAKTADAVFCA